MKRTLFLSASICALISSGAFEVAHAQSSSTDGVETVVVTAERRNEDLMKTPISAEGSLITDHTCSPRTTADIGR